MCKTFTCILNDDCAVFSDLKAGEEIRMPIRTYDDLIVRRQRAKLSVATRIAGSLYKQYALTAMLEAMGADPTDTPVVVFNRYANWDYVADTMCKDQRTTLDGVNNYVATAWFPATVQGYLTIENSNKGEAITIACKDASLRSAVIESAFRLDKAGARTGVVLVGTFEAVPARIGTVVLEGARPGAFGAFTLVSSEDTPEQIAIALTAHEELYANVVN